MRCGFILFLLSTGFLALSCSDPAAAERLYARASDAYIREDFSNALSLADEAVRADGDFFQARLLKAKILIFTEKTGDAEKILRALCKRYPEFTEARLWYVRALIMTERYDKAEELLERELALNQTDWRFYYQYALLAQKQNALDKRLAMCRLFAIRKSCISKRRIYGSRSASDRMRSTRSIKPMRFPRIPMQLRK